MVLPAHTDEILERVTLGIGLVRVIARRAWLLALDVAHLADDGAILHELLAAVRMGAQVVGHGK